jgi:hypothetical protein
MPCSLWANLAGCRQLPSACSDRPARVPRPTVEQPGEATRSTRRSPRRGWCGVLADAVGYRPTLYAAAVGFGLVSTCVAISSYRHARLDDTP